MAYDAHQNYRPPPRQYYDQGGYDNAPYNDGYGQAQQYDGYGYDEGYQNGYYDDGYGGYSGGVRHLEALHEAEVEALLRRREVAEDTVLLQGEEATEVRRREVPHKVDGRRRIMLPAAIRWVAEDPRLRMLRRVAPERESSAEDEQGK
ncbi:hypothetical protein UCDDS831_g07688 [Diplodia seriata]|uniref:Uncharacterized protein n=1 Tax=Diplodia seriata TaxID=420778 RepID=A0A0G2FTR7_9PEZI|nr:hypothetical protein UCDDS831_g07688 [Diplodia seriata]